MKKLLLIALSFVAGATTISAQSLMITKSDGTKFYFSADEMSTLNFSEETVAQTEAKQTVQDKVVGTWIYDDSGEGVDRIIIRSDGTGLYQEHVGDPEGMDQGDFTWTLNGSTFIRKEKNGEYGYKSDAPEYDYDTLVIVGSNDNFILYYEPDEPSEFYCYQRFGGYDADAHTGAEILFGDSDLGKTWKISNHDAYTFYKSGTGLGVEEDAAWEFHYTYNASSKELYIVYTNGEYGEKGKEDAPYWKVEHYTVSGSGDTLTMTENGTSSTWTAVTKLRE